MSDQISAPNTVSRSNGTQSYRDLLVWQKSMALAKEIYKLTAKFPPEEKFGLISQMRRATVSVPSNIAEGQARNTTGEFVQFISHAEGSLAELDTQLTLAVELNFLSSEKAAACLDSITELRRMLNGLRRAVTGQKPSTHHSPLVTRH
ncbi:MAG TPA: four helix bundle protein [Verrucomicrobiae bacterium]|jgi:four helix bundle protein|nr:four helix bundle protein [Verrucomicrobiae bacterium]